MVATIKILVIDDDPSLLAVLEAGLRLHQEYDVKATMLADEAMHMLGIGAYDLVVTDYALNNPRINGLEILRQARRVSPQTLVIIVTAFASLEISIEAIHLGAYDFLTKPFQLDELLLVVRNACNTIRLNRENKELREQVGELIASLDEIEKQHIELLDRLKQWDCDGGLAATAPLGGGNMNMIQMMEMKRRLMRDQINNYLRMGETIRDRLARERQKIETLYQNGLVSETAYRQAMRDGRLETREN